MACTHECRSRVVADFGVWVSNQQFVISSERRIGLALNEQQSCKMQLQFGIAGMAARLLPQSCNLPTGEFGMRQGSQLQHHRLTEGSPVSLRPEFSELLKVLFRFIRF